MALIAEYGYNEGTGTNAADSSGNSHAGTLGATATWAAGHTSNAASFNGTTTSIITSPNAADLQITGSITLMAWVYYTVNATSRIITKCVNGTTDGYELSVSSGGVPFFRLNQFTSADTYRRNASGALTLNTWTHIAGVYDGTTMYIYINGTLSGSNITGPGSILTSTTVLGVGNESGGAWPISGRIDDARIFNTALTSTDVNTWMGTPVPVFATGSGSMSFGASATGAGAATAAGAISLTGSATTAGADSGSGSVTFTGSAVGSTTGAGTISLTGSAVGKAPATASGSLAITATSADSGSPSASGAVVFSGTATPGGSVAASGTGAMALTGSAVESSAAAGTIGFNAFATSGAPIVLGHHALTGRILSGTVARGRTGALTATPTTGRLSRGGTGKLTGLHPSGTTTEAP